MSSLMLMFDSHGGWGDPALSVGLGVSEESNGVSAETFGVSEELFGVL